MMICSWIMVMEVMDVVAVVVLLCRNVSIEVKGIDLR